jgi:dipeptidyl aminopeptidase/acylaminoacyl peptidase
VAVLRQLAKRDPSIDLDRAGVVGGSAGGYATLRALFTYPDVFKAGMAAAPYNNPKVLMPDFTEKFMGPESGSNYSDVAVAPLAGALKGKLLLTAGEMDWTVTPWPTLQIVDSLVKAHKDFAFVLAPNVDHSPLTLYGDPMLLRGWNFFVTDLMGARPPENYVFPTDARPH